MESTEGRRVSVRFDRTAEFGSLHDRYLCIPVYGYVIMLVCRCSVRYPIMGLSVKELNSLTSLHACC